MKGIDAAVATILLLMITISLVGFAFVWFNRLSKSAAKNIENQTMSQLNEQAMKITLISASSSSGKVIISNIGSVPIPANRAIIIVNGNLDSTVSQSLAPQQTIEVALKNGCNPGDEVKVSIGSYTDYGTCE